MREVTRAGAWPPSAAGRFAVAGFAAGDRGRAAGAFAGFRPCCRLCRRAVMTSITLPRSRASSGSGWMPSPLSLASITARSRAAVHHVGRRGVAGLPIDELGRQLHISGSGRAVGTRENASSLAALFASVRMVQCKCTAPF